MGDAIERSRKLFSEHEPLRRLSEQSAKTVQRAITFYDLDHIFLMFSGGNDSAVLVDWFHRIVEPEVNIDIEVLHIDTEIGIEETRQWAEKFTKNRDMDWRRVSVSDVKNDPDYSGGKTYRELVYEYGFPGPGKHGMAYTYLKQRPIRKACKDAKENYRDRIGFFTGVRSDESDRRMGNTIRYQRNGAKCWVSPIMGWTNRCMTDYRRLVELERNEVADLLHMSGECLCGAFAYGNEREEVRLFYPEVIEEIEQLEEEVQEAFQEGSIEFNSSDYCVWGHGNADGKIDGDHPLCTGCESRMKIRSELD